MNRCVHAGMEWTGLEWMEWDGIDWDGMEWHGIGGISGTHEIRGMGGMKGIKEWVTECKHERVSE